jgi:hypothetical protein
MKLHEVAEAIEAPLESPEQRTIVLVPDLADSIFTLEGGDRIVAYVLLDESEVIDRTAFIVAVGASFECFVQLVEVRVLGFGLHVGDFWVEGAEFWGERHRSGVGEVPWW